MRVIPVRPKAVRSVPVTGSTAGELSTGSAAGRKLAMKNRASDSAARIASQRSSRSSRSYRSSRRGVRSQNSGVKSYEAWSMQGDGGALHSEFWLQRVSTHTIVCRHDILIYATPDAHDTLNTL